MKGMCNYLGIPMPLEMHVSLHFTEIKAFCMYLSSVLQKQIPLWLKFSVLGFPHARHANFVLSCSPWIVSS